MALVRVYCGLASTQAVGDRPDPSQPWLTVAVVDDSGRLLDVCGITDDPAGYVELGAVLAERSGGFASVAVAADHDEHTVTMLLAAAGRALAIADEDSLDDYADRFGDDESAEELNAPLAERRAIGIARALQAGALAATVQGAPRELLALKPVLAAHGALATGRQAAAVALREVLRELYPAALRAYPDPTASIPLAILDALPEPGLLGGGAPNRTRDAAVIAALADSGLADANRISEAVTALRVAIAETPRRTGIGKSLTTAVAETIRQSVAAVRAFDTAIGAVVGLLTEKATPAPATLPGRPLGDATGPVPLRAVREPAAPARMPAAAPARTPAAPVREPVEPGRPSSGRRPRVHTAPTSGIPASNPRVPIPTSSIPASGIPGSGIPTSGIPASGIPTSGIPASGIPASGIPAAASASAPPAYNRPAPLPKRPVTSANPLTPPPAYGGIPAPRLSPEVAAPGSREEWPLNPAAQSDRSGEFALVIDPLSPTSYPSGLQPLVETGNDTRWREPANGHEAAPTRDRDPRARDPYARDSYERDAYARDSYDRDSYDRDSFDRDPFERDTFNRDTFDRDPFERDLYDRDPLADRDGRERMPLRRPAPAAPPVAPPAAPANAREDRVPPPWLADDLPPEPAMLRLVEPAPLADPALRAATEPLRGRTALDGDRPLEDRYERAGRGAPSLRLIGGSAPVDDESDGDLLIFSQIQSAWFADVDDIETPATVWDDNPADAGWLAAEKAASPILGDATMAGLPRRVPQANLVPGSPLPAASQRGPRVSRDPAAMATHATGYFRGSRRGEESRGFSIGGRPGRESAGGWDFSRDNFEADRDEPYEYRSAARR